MIPRKSKTLREISFKKPSEGVSPTSAPNSLASATLVSYIPKQAGSLKFPMKKPWFDDNSLLYSKEESSYLVPKIGKLFSLTQNQERSLYRLIKVMNSI